MTQTQTQTQSATQRVSETTAPREIIVIQLPLNYDPDVTAYVFDPEDGTEYDTITGWECAVQYAHDGYIVVPVNGDVYPFDTVAKLEARLNYEHAIVADCFGRTVPEIVG